MSTVLVTDGLELDPQRPHRMLAAVDLGALERRTRWPGSTSTRCIRNRFDRRERPDPRPQLDVPGRQRILGDELGACTSRSQGG